MEEKIVFLKCRKTEEVECCRDREEDSGKSYKTFFFFLSLVRAGVIRCLGPVKTFFIRSLNSTHTKANVEKLLFFRADSLFEFSNLVFGSVPEGNLFFFHVRRNIFSIS